jgi:hypothetical protein
MLEPVKLSLATFQPDKCYPPYLNTPRSLEACRMNGINPLELVELPFSEFQRDFPNDLDAARRRFERIDGARRRMLENVKTDWKKLCDSKWKPPAKTRPRSAKETILVVNPQAHCQLLEIQAAKFRKIERDNWTELQRHLKVEIMKADQEVQNKQILLKHDEMEEMHNEQQNERRLYLQELHREELMQRKMDEEEEMMEIREEQKKFQEDILKHSRSEKERMKREKMRREERLIERYQRDKYTQQVKDSIMNGIDQKVDNRRKMSEMRLKNDEERVKEFFERRGRERTEKMKELDSKIERVRSEKERISEENRKAVNDKIAEHERYRQQIEEQREKYKREVAPLEQNQSQEKLNKIRERTNNMTEDKSNRTLSALQLKEDIARRELEKVREAQERRRAIKSIRQEAHEIALRRAQKAEEYRMNKIKEDIKNKEERMSAIKQGFHVLDHMRNTMKDIMVKTDIELKEGLHRLKHIDEFSPDKVAIKAMEIGNQFLFPRYNGFFLFVFHVIYCVTKLFFFFQNARLEKKFGIETHDDDPMKKLFHTTGGMNTNDSMNNFGFGFTTEPLTEMDTAPLYEGDRTALTAAHGRNTGRNAKNKNHGGRSASPGTREAAATLPIQQLNPDNLKNSLLQSIVSQFSFFFCKRFYSFIFFFFLLFPSRNEWKCYE